MGTAPSKPTQSYRVMVVGPSRSGKTSMLYQARDASYTTKSGVKPSHKNVCPTIGTNVESFYLPGTNIRLDVMDFGTDFQLEDEVEKHFSVVDGIIFVVDSENRTSLSQARTSLSDMFTHPQLLNTPCMVVANKRDASSAMDLNQIENVLGLNVVNQKRPLRAELVGNSMLMKEGRNALAIFESLATEIIHIRSLSSSNSEFFDRHDQKILNDTCGQMFCNFLACRRTLKFAVVGLASAGKTKLIDTCGSARENLFDSKWSKVVMPGDNTEILLREYHAGEINAHSLSNKFDGVFFVVDSSDRSHLEQANVFLNKKIFPDAERFGIPVVVVGNKKDKQDGVRTEIDLAMRLNVIENNKVVWHIIMTSTITQKSAFLDCIHVMIAHVYW